MTTTTADLKNLYNKDKKKKILVIFALFLALIITVLISLSLGAASPRIGEAIHVIFYKGLPFLHIEPPSPLAIT